MIYAAIVILAAIVGLTLYNEIRKSPLVWTCGYCHNEVMGAKECPYCGTKKEE